MLKQIKGFPNYFVSDEGYVVGARGNVLKVDLNKAGYQRVSLCSDGVVTRRFVHRIVAETFLEHNEDNPIINHIDGNKLNNCVSNLEWTTHKKNLKHALDTKLRDMTTKVQMSRDTRDSVLSDLRDGTLTYQRIADKHNVTYNAVALLKRRYLERATTIPNGSTSQVNGDGSAQPSEEVMI